MKASHCLSVLALPLTGTGWGIVGAGLFPTKPLLACARLAIQNGCENKFLRLGQRYPAMHVEAAASSPERKTVEVRCKLQGFAHCRKLLMLNSLELAAAKG